MANQYDTNLKLQAIADAIGDTSSSGLISALEDIADAVAGGGGGSSAGLVSDNFSETDTYDLGDYCIHNNTLYVCINAITTPGSWDLSDWQATNAGIQLSSLNSALGRIKAGYANVTIPANSSASVNVTFNVPLPTGTSYAPIISQSDQYAYTGIYLGSTNRTETGFTITASSSRTASITIQVMWAIVPFN